MLSQQWENRAVFFVSLLLLCNNLVWLLMMKKVQTLVFLLLLPAMLLVTTSCRKKQQHPPTSVLVPDEPIQKLTWESAQRTKSGLRHNGAEPGLLRTGSIENAAHVPEPAFDYFLHSLNLQLEMAGFQVSNASSRILTGVLTRSADELIFSFRVQEDNTILYSDSAGVPDDSRLKGTLAQFESGTDQVSKPEVHHHEVAIPTPVVQLKSPPLDVNSFCPVAGEPCEIMLLYEDHLVLEDWKNNSHRDVPLSGFSSIRSRSPSGKIYFDADGFTIMHNNLSILLRLNPALVPLSSAQTLLLPVPERGSNTFLLADGHFYDFDLVGGKILVAVDTDYNLNVAERGNLVRSSQKVGGSVTSALPVIYTSAFVPPGNMDSVMKFHYENGVLAYESSRQLDGEILDVFLTDLNQDRELELLVTLKTERGIFIEVLTPF